MMRTMPTMPVNIISITFDIAHVIVVSGGSMYDFRCRKVGVSSFCVVSFHFSCRAAHKTNRELVCAARVRASIRSASKRANYQKETFHVSSAMYLAWVNMDISTVGTFKTLICCTLVL